MERDWTSSFKEGITERVLHCGRLELGAYLARALTTLLFAKASECIFNMFATSRPGDLAAD